MTDPGHSLPTAASAPWRALRSWYLATPLLAALDLGFGINVRTTFLDSIPARLLYYAVAFACGLAVLRWPARAPLVGLLESGSNIVWLVLGVGLRYLAAIDAVLADDAAAAAPFTSAEILNLIVSAAVLIVSYIAAQPRQRRVGGPDWTA